MQAFTVAFGVVLLAELGDRTQLLVVTQAGRHRLLPTLAGLAAVIAVLQAIAVTIGAALGELLPERVTLAVTGVLFVGFAAWTWFDRHEAHEQTVGSRGLGRLLAAYFVAELGDKSMLAAAALAAANGVVGTWAGATLGLFAATVVGVVAGRALGRVVPAPVLRGVGAAVLLAVGVAALVAAAID